MLLFKYIGAGSFLTTLEIFIYGIKTQKNMAELSEKIDTLKNSIQKDACISNRVLMFVESDHKNGNGKPLRHEGYIFMFGEDGLILSKEPNAGQGHGVRCEGHEIKYEKIIGYRVFN